jgi:hypothetical protein
VNLLRVTGIVCLVAGACQSASPPRLPALDGSFATTDGGDGGNVGWADTVVAFVASGVTMTCAAALPACGTPAPGCGADAALGPADGQTFALAPGDNVLVAFRCATILAHGGGEAVPDFTVWADVAPGGAGVVEVSPDGDSFASVGTLIQSDPSFSLARVGASAAKFVRICNTGVSDLSLDAIEAR